MSDHEHPHDHVPDEELVAQAREGLDALAEVDADHVASLWDGIAAAAFDDAPGDTPDDAADQAAPAVTDAVGEPARQPPDESASEATDDGVVTSLSAHRARRSLPTWVTAAAAALVLVVGGTWFLSRSTPQEVATFAMDPLDDRVATEVDGDIVMDGDQTVVEVDLSALPPLDSDAFYELWLLDLDNEQLVSLGEVDATTTAVPVAGDVDTTSFPVIDVSVEPRDGEPAHSGDSVLRGPITAADDGG